MLHIPADLTSLIASNSIAFFLTTILPVWLVGLVTGLLAPRQAVLSDVRAFATTAAVGALSFGVRSTLLSQIVTFINGVMFIQSLWYRWTNPGTFHRLCASAARAIGVPLGKDKGTSDGNAYQPSKPAEWYVTEDDLETFLRRTGTDPVANAGAWESIVDKEISGKLKYQSQRRMLRDIRKTEYISTSISVDTTPQEVRSLLFKLPSAPYVAVERAAK